MEKIKDIIIIIIFIIGFIGVIGLLMAWNDGLLDGTLIAKILSLVFPSLLGMHIILLIYSYWSEKILGEVRFIKIIGIISFLSLVLCIMFLDIDTLFIIAMIIFVLVVISLIVFWIEQIINSTK
jgi:hypothetical protein